MNKVNFYDTKKVKAEDFLKLRGYINQSLKKVCSSEYGIIKKGFNLTLKDNTITCSPGIGFAPNGDFIEVKQKKQEKIKEEDLSYITSEDKVILCYLGYLRINGKDDYHLAYLEFNKTEEFDPYKMLSLKSNLLIGMIHNGKFFLLNREDQVPNFPVGTVIPYIGEFTDYITLRGCINLSAHFKGGGAYIKLSKSFSIFYGQPNPEGSMVLTENHIPSFGTDYGGGSFDIPSGSGYYSGGHNHEIKEWPGINIGGDEPSPYIEGFREPSFSNNTTDAGEHNHTFDVTHTNDNPAPIELNPPFYNVRLIYRVY